MSPITFNPFQLLVPDLKPERKAEAIARKWGVSVQRVRRELDRGLRHEMEHTGAKSIARIIASHHIWEDLSYYPKLERWHK